MGSTNILTTFNVRRRNPELIPPAKPTPHEFKRLSDIDDQEGHRFQFPGILFYRKNNAMKGKDPVHVIREAIAKTLVFYYPLAGRLREFATRKLVVECTGEGVMFTEADADVTLEEFGDELYPPFPCVDELLYDVPGSSGIINCPLLLFQVTRLKCGGFILASRFNHTLADAYGIIQFLSAVAEIGRGAEIPSIVPIWQRHLFNARCPPHISCTHHEYDVVHDNKETSPTPVPVDDDTVQRSFFFGAAEISALRSHLPLHLRRCTTFELLAACLWRCRTIAISPHPLEEVRLACIVDLRNRFNPPLIGYYGNAFVFPVAITIAKDLTENPLHYALELVKEIKSNATEEYMKSVADLMVIRGRPSYKFERSYRVSDITRVGAGHVDFGWGKAVYGGPLIYFRGASHCISVENNKGESGIVVPIGLPAKAMEVFERQVEMMVKRNNNDDDPAMESSGFIKSAI